MPMSKPSPYSARRTKLSRRLSTAQALLISRPTDILYFTGMHLISLTEREALLLVTRETATLFHSPLLQPVTDKKLEAIPHFKLDKIKQKLTEISGITHLHVDAEDLHLGEYRRMRAALPLEITELDRSWIWHQRLYKSTEEHKLLQKAGSYTDQLYEIATDLLKPGVTEAQVALEIEYACKKLGCELAFPPIVAFGANTAVPHHLPGKTVLKKEMAVLFDLGARYQGYCGDMTRSLWFGDSPPAEYQKITKVVHDAYQAATDRLNDTLGSCTAGELDAAARAVIEQAGYAPYFIHTTGHGIGLEAHEPPALYATDETILKPGMIITIEPGIYLPGKFGVRYENSVSIVKSNVVVINKITH